MSQSCSTLQDQTHFSQIPFHNHIQEENIEIHFVKTTEQLADIFTKPLPEGPFVHILRGLGMMEAHSAPSSR